MRNRQFLFYWILSLVTSIFFIPNADGQEVLNKTFSINLDKVKIEKAIKAVGVVTKVKFNYSNGSINLNTVVSYKADNKKIIDFINDILIPNGISYQEVNGTVVLFPLKRNTSTTINPEQVKESTNAIIVSGFVKDSIGNPLIGVTVKLKGTNVSTITDKNGHYFINTNNTNQLLIFFMLVMPA